MTTAKETIIEKILTDLPIASCRGEMTKEEWRGWFEEAFEKGEKYASQSKWVRCAERLPETEGKYLVLFNLHHDGDAQCVAEFQYVPRHNFENPPIDKRWFVYPSGGSELRTITHWQPLPDKPVEK